MTLPMCLKCLEKAANDKAGASAWPVVRDGVIHLRRQVDGVFVDKLFVCGEEA